jgi:ornithine cyclodeaminase/alanine dehydrogenase-like protein (mu-crystallin family)
MRASIPVIDAERTRRLLPFDALIPSLREAFAGGATVPTRHHHSIEQGGGTDAVLLLMPAWQPGGLLGVKIATIFPGNGARGLPGVHSTYLLSDATTGAPLALLDGDEITERRTVGVAALGASYLARPDARSLLIVGSGRIAGIAAQAFAAVRPIDTVRIWDRTIAKAEALAERLRGLGLAASATPDLEHAVRRSDIVSCATLATEPLIRGEWLQPGCHLDLIGSFTPDMREADDLCMVRGRIHVDTPAALLESGDLVRPLAAGIVDAHAIGLLSQLCSGELGGRENCDDITIFKAVGTALSDLAAGVLAYRSLSSMTA